MVMLVGSEQPGVSDQADRVLVREAERRLAAGNPAGSQVLLAALARRPPEAVPAEVLLGLARALRHADEPDRAAPVQDRPGLSPRQRAYLRPLHPGGGPGRVPPGLRLPGRPGLLTAGDEDPHLGPAAGHRPGAGRHAVPQAGHLLRVVRPGRLLPDPVRAPRRGDPALRRLLRVPHPSSSGSGRSRCRATPRTTWCSCAGRAGGSRTPGFTHFARIRVLHDEFQLGSARRRAVLAPVLPGTTGWTVPPASPSSTPPPRPEVERVLAAQVGAADATVYLRFFLHPADQSNEDSLLAALVSVSVLPGGFRICAEFRTTMDGSLPKVYGDQCRRYLDEQAFADKLRRTWGFEIQHLEAGRGLSPYEGVDPHLARIARMPGRSPAPAEL